MKSVPEIVVTDRIRVPKKLIPEPAIRKRYEITLFQDEKCAKCDNFEDRSKDNDVCISCSNFGGYYRFFNAKELRTKKVWSLPQADEHSIRHYLDKKGKEYKWVDNRVVHKMEHPVKFIGRLYRDGDVDDEGRERPDQIYAARQWWKKKTGIIQAPARSGKTVLATFLTCKLGLKTVIIASQKDWLRQFYETMTGKLPPRYLRNKIVETEGIVGRTKVTNIADLQEETGKQIVFQPESFGALQRFMENTGEVPDILLITYQSFRKDDRRIAEILNKHYSFAIIDEEHSAAATEYLKFVSKLNMSKRLGLSATPNRKDGRSGLSRLVFGPVVSVINTSTLKPRITFKVSTAKPRNVHKTWTGAFSWIIHSKERNIEIVKQVFKDLRSGHDVIVVPVDYKKHVNLLVRMINHQAKINYKKKGENWPGDLAREFHAGVNRSEVLSWVDSRDENEKVHKKLPTKSPRVLVAIRSMIRQGIDIKRPSAIYCVLPMSATRKDGAPMFYQMAYRVATPYGNKPEPLVRVWIDQVDMFKTCVSGLLWNEIFPQSNIKMGEDCRYLLDSHQIELVKNSTSKKRRQAPRGGEWW